MNYQDLTDEEIIEAIQEGLKEDGRVNIEFMEIECSNGRPLLAGRVPSDEEVEIIDEIMKDVLEFDEYENNVWVDDALAFESSDDEEEGKGRFEDEEEDDEDELEEAEPLSEDDEDS